MQSAYFLKIIFDICYKFLICQVLFNSLVLMHIYLYFCMLRIRLDNTSLKLKRYACLQSTSLYHLIK